MPRKRASKRRIIARYRIGRWIARADIENHRGAMKRLFRIGEFEWNPVADFIRRKTGER